MSEDESKPMSVPPGVCMDPWAHYPPYSPGFSGVWVGKPLTDRKIAEYERRGFYSAEYRKVRRERMVKKMGKRKRSEPEDEQWPKRDGAWLKMADGRMIYSPR